MDRESQSRGSSALAWVLVGQVSTFPWTRWDADVVVRVKVEASADIAEVVVATTLASVMAEVTNSTVLAEAVGALASTGSATTGALGGNGTDADTTNQAVSVTSPAHRGEL